MLVFLYTPYWQTNDDPIFSMLINGYGLASEPATQILNCNFIWAKIIRVIPNFLDIQNYTWALYIFSFLAMIAIWNSVIHYPGNSLIKLLIIINMLFYNFLNPQYTVTASYCAIASVIIFMEYFHHNKFTYIIIAFFFAFFSFIIREISFASIILIGIFLYPWRLILNNKTVIAFLAIFLAVICAVYFIDMQGKSSSDWQYINIWQKNRQSLSDDYQADVYLQQPALLNKLGYTENDLQLLKAHFSIDSNLRNPDRLSELKNGIDKTIFYNNALEKGGIALAFFFTYPLIFFSIIALILLINRFTPFTMATLALFITIFFFIGFFNRGGVEVHRVYYPAIFYFILLLITRNTNENLKNYIYLNPALAKLIIFCFLLLPILAFSKNNLVEQWRISSYDINKSGEYLKNALWLTWKFPIEQIYQPFAKVSAFSNINFQSGGWSALLPNSVKYFDPMTANGFGDKFSEGIKVAADEGTLKLLSTYCHEHLNGRMDSERLSPPDCFDVYNIICSPIP